MEIEIGCGARSKFALFIVPFAIIWSAGGVGIPTSIILKGNAPPMIYFVLAVFGLGAICVLSVAAYACLGKLVVSLRGSDGVIFMGIGPLGWKRRFDVSNVQTVFIGQSDITQNGQTVPAIVIEGPKRIKFASGMSEERLNFMAGALSQSIPAKAT